MRSAVTTNRTSRSLSVHSASTDGNPCIVSTTPLKKAKAGSGIARYASGIQPWNGNAGILIKNASANVTKIHFCVPSGSGFAARSLNTKLIGSSPGDASTAVATAPASISSEPMSV